jgi:hypothetical protein
VNGWSWAWTAWIVAFFVIELTGAYLTPKSGNTLSEHVWNLIQGRGRWHWLARALLVTGLAWLSTHLLTGGWV